MKEQKTAKREEEMNKKRVNYCVKRLGESSSKPFIPDEDDEDYDYFN